MVLKYGKIFRGMIGVICTHSDADVDGKLVKELRDEGIDMQAWYELNNVCKDEVKKIKQLDKEVKAARNRKSRQKNAQLLETQKKDEEAKIARKVLKTIELRRFEFAVQARNQYVTEELRNMLENYVAKGTTLDVHCISNSHYAAIKSGKAVQGGRLSPEATERAALDKTTHVERRAELLELARVPLDKLDGKVETRVGAFKDGIKSGLVNVLHSQFSTTRDTAVKVLDQKRKKHSATIRAFIRKNGNHSTQMCPKESWNEQFLKGITEFIDEHWETFENSRTQITDQLKDALIQDMHNILPDIAREHPLSSKALPTVRLAELVQAQIENLNNAFRNDLYPYSQDLRNIRMDVTQDSNRNYFSRNIQVVYDECHEDSGEGVTKRCLARIEAHLTKGQADSPFTKVERSLTSALIKNDAKHTSANTESVKERVKSIFSSLYQSFDRLIDKTVEDPREKVAREGLQEILGELEMEYEVAKEMLMQVKAKYAD
ncbi:hypothetical protein LTR17_015706 [Elasticomyces elasticus]|nr:hypothetical protein LTR17_015706 [Elasticomyces elasticus]